MSKRGTAAGFVVVAAAAFGVWQLYRIQKEAEPDEEAVDVVPEVQVHTATVTLTNLHASVLAYGSVEPDPGRDEASAAKARITAPAAGLVADVLCREGAAVSRGDVLFRMDGRLAALAIGKARQAVAFAEKDLSRQKLLLQTEATSEKLVQEAEQQLAAARQELASAETESALLSVTAPVSGTVLQINARSGETVEAGRELAEVADLKRLVLVASVPRREADLIKEGMPADVSNGDEASARWPGAVAYIDPRVDPQNDTVRLRVSLPPDVGLRSGQFAQARVVYADLQKRLAVPLDSLERTDDGQCVLKVVQGNQAVQKPVTAGLRDGDWIEVQGEGISNGMQVVTAGGYGLPDKTMIRVITP